MRTVDILLIFLVIFGLLGWYIWRMLRYTRDTVGENSPFVVKRTYQLTAQEYWNSWTMRINYMLYSVCVLALISPFWALPFRADGASNTGMLTIGYILYGIFWLLCFCLLLHNGILDLNYWHHSRDKTIIFDPQAGTVQFITPTQVLTLRDKAELKKIVAYSNDKPKNSYGYYRLYFAGGEELILTDRSPGLWVVLEYFQHAFTESHYQYFPFIR
ncbi:hypothetical protein GCM10027275_28370 [Rhabdobacter roseus]|uniref:PH domain-containing protein n=1 Tax=Rhabdobacter roseus TaxID=1655419 RepID=A0A840TPE2_9BACT|nr:hypothetical protein [Rhabdobacter roseus]MBB5284785.1 hypothetical protein [Rhabdobacter roseus]